MSQSIGRAYIEIAPSTRGLGKSIEADLDGSMANVEKKSTGRFRSMFGTVAKIGAGAIGILGGLFTAKVLQGGFSRLMNIENAQASLKGLGHDTQMIEAIMKNALDSVKGTAFGLDTAATVASTAVAAGIEPGKELERYLRLTADAATIAGVSMEEMGSIINKTTTRGRVSMENLNQLQERNIPIVTWLAESYGVAGDEMERMVARGEVDAEHFRKVLEENLGGAALESGNTTEGAFKNLNAAMSRLGVSILAAPFPLLKDLFGELTVLLDGVGERMGPLIERITGGFADRIAPVIDGMGERVLGLIDAFASGESSLGGLMAILNPLGQVLAGVLPAFAELGGVLREIGGAIGRALIPVLPLVGDALVAILGAVTPLLPVLADLVGDLVGALAPALPPLVEALSGVVDVVVALVPVLGAGLLRIVEALTPVLMLLADGIVVLVEALAPLVPVVADVLGLLITLAADVLVQLVETLAPVVGLILELAADLLPVLAGVLGTLLSALAPIIDVIGVLLEALMPVIDILVALGGEVLGAVVDILMALLPPLADLVTLLVSALAPILSTVARIIGAVLTPIVSVLSKVLSTLIGWISTAVSWLGEKLTVALQAVIGWFNTGKDNFAVFSREGIARITEFAQSVVERIGDVIRWFRELPERIKAVFSGAGDWLKGAARRIIQGFIDGLTGAFRRVKDTLSSLTNLLPDWKGPKQRDLKLLRDPGRWVMEGFVGGLESQYGLVQRSLSGLTSSLSADVSGIALPEYLNVIDADGVFQGTIRTQAGLVMRGRVSPLSVGKAAWGT